MSEIDKNAVMSIGYGLYVLTAHEGEKDNGCIINVVAQLTDNPMRIMITVNSRKSARKPHRTRHAEHEREHARKRFLPAAPAAKALLRPFGLLCSRSASGFRSGRLHGFLLHRVFVRDDLRIADKTPALVRG